ncbi:choice-of-anchor R domain-containing protein [Candidatus Poriferisodalis sp.]|uniref:choice-of-anchor R domain-containing protein n=1 Tax=Candidatus Poriferisodalis sp. TaxID=3101277 RepID=UPI003B52FCF8
MTGSRRLAPLSMLLIGTAVLVALIGPGTTAQAQANNTATGLPRVVVSAESPGILAADIWDIRDADGLPYGAAPGATSIGDPDDGKFIFDFSYQWIRVDGSNDTNVGTDSQRYQLVEADFGKKFKVRVSFTDRADNAEAVTSVPFGPIARPTLLSASSLVSNTGQSPSATAMITSTYAMNFNLGSHGQGYEISSVSIDLAAVPSSLSVSLWTGGPPGSGEGGSRRAKLFEFVNPDPFAVGLNEFTAPLGVHALQVVDHWIVLSNFGSSLSIKKTTSDGEDAGSETGAVLANEVGGDTSVVRLAINGSRRTQGILAANFAQSGDEGNQEVISLGDKIGFTIALGAADRFLVRGMSIAMDDTTHLDGGFDNPWFFRSDDFDGTIHFRLGQTRKVNGLPTFTAPQGATVSGESTYLLQKGLGTEFEFTNDGDTIERVGAVLSRIQQVDTDADGRSDVPTGAGTTLGKGGDLSDNDAAGPTPRMAVYGVPLYTVVKNLGQTDNGYVSVGGTNDVVSQGFTTGSRTGGYSLQGIGVNIEGSAVSGTDQVPADASAVSVSVHADASGQPGAKLFDLLSPTEYAAGLSFFEAPRGKRLDASTSYVLVWRHNSGANHRLVRTTGNSEDSGGETGASIADAFRLGPDVTDLTQDSGGNALEISVYSGQTPPNATGRPVILPTAEGHGVLAVDTSGISDPQGIPNVGSLESTGPLRNFSYRWIRVDGATETVVGVDQVDYRQVGAAVNDLGVRVESGRYRLVEEDFGKLLRVEASFVDEVGSTEIVSSLPFRPVREPPRLLPAATLVSNTRQSPSATATITSARYSLGFKLGVHGQGYDISGVSIDLAAVPDRLQVSLWAGSAHLSAFGGAYTKLFEFENPESFRVGLNEFKAPPAAFVYQNLEYFIVLSGFGDSLSIKRTASDDEDGGGEPGATIEDQGDSAVLRLAVKGHRRDHGILVSTYGQEDTEGNQEIVSSGDDIGLNFTVGEADRYLIRGVTFSVDDTSVAGGFSSPWSLRDGTDELFKLISTRQINGINEFTAPQGMTVEGGCTTSMGVETCEEYNIYKDGELPIRQGGVILTRYGATDSTDEDAPKAAGVSIGGVLGDFALNDKTPNPVRAFMAIFGEPLNAMVQNLGQTDGVWRAVGGSSATTASQGFTAGSGEFGYRLKGIAVNINGSDNSNGVPQVPDGPASVAVSVHADSGGKPGAKLFDLISPIELGADDRFFEAPPRAYLDPDTSYHLVWRHTGGTPHRLQLTDAASEDSGALTGASIADEFRRGSASESNKALEIAVYTDVLTKGPPVAGGILVPLSWTHIPDGADAGDQFRLLYVTHHATQATSSDAGDYHALAQFEASGRSKRYPGAAGRYTNQFIQRAAEQFKAVVCTNGRGARRNADMPGTGVAVHWLDGGYQHRPTLVANTYSEFFSADWANRDWGAYVTGNSAHFEEHAMVWTGCDASGAPDPMGPMGSATAVVAAGSPRDPDRAPLGSLDADDANEFLGIAKQQALPLYAISPVFTVYGDGSPRTIWSASMTVGTLTDTAGSTVSVFAGSGSTFGEIIGSTQFTYEGTAYTVSHLQTERQTLSGSLTADNLHLQMASLPPADSDSKLVLELDGKRFALADAVRSTNFYSWGGPGLSWADGETVEIRLIELSD